MQCTNRSIVGDWYCTFDDVQHVGNQRGQMGDVSRSERLADVSPARALRYVAFSVKRRQMCILAINAAKPLHGGAVARCSSIVRHD